MEEWQVDVYSEKAVHIFFTRASCRKEAKNKVREHVPLLSASARAITASKSSSYTLPFHTRMHRSYHHSLYLCGEVE